MIKSIAQAAAELFVVCKGFELVFEAIRILDGVLGIAHYRPSKFGSLSSMNAVVPSVISSVDNNSPNA